MTKKLLFISLILLSLAQISFGQKTISPAKKKIAAQLTTQTVELFPIDYFEETFSTMNSKESDRLKKELSDSLLEKMNQANNLTEEDKDVLKQRIADFTLKVSQLLKITMSKGFNLKIEANKSLEKNYLKIFTLAELQKLNKFFKTSNGQNFVKTFNQLVTGQIQNTDSGMSAEDEKSFEVIGKSLGEKTLVKFTDSLVKNTMDDISQYITNWGDQLVQKIEKETTKGEIKKEMDRFLAENFKQ